MCREGGNKYQVAVYACTREASGVVILEVCLWVLQKIAALATVCVPCPLCGGFHFYVGDFTPGNDPFAAVHGPGRAVQLLLKCPKWASYRIPCQNWRRAKLLEPIPAAASGVELTNSPIINPTQPDCSIPGTW